ncbi:OB-fold nucleic acid binding domain-containing protein [Nonomuraea ferruginea]
MTDAEMVEAELEILGMDISRHVVSFHDELLDALGVTRAKDLLGPRNGAEVLVVGVKVATQTPAIRSGQRIIFATLDDSTGPVDLTFFESVQGRCAATVFGSWLLLVRGAVRRTGARAVSIRALDCWNLADLDALWRARGLDAVRAELARPPGRPGPGGRPRHRVRQRLPPVALRRPGPGRHRPAPPPLARQPGQLRPHRGLILVRRPGPGG